MSGHRELRTIIFSFMDQRILIEILPATTIIDDLSVDWKKGVHLTDGRNLRIDISQLVPVDS